MAQDIGLLLRGLGASFSNQVPQFRQELAQEDQARARQQEMQMRQQEFSSQQAERSRNAQMQSAEMMQARQAAAFQDAEAALRMGARGDWEGIIGLAEDRMRLDQEMGGPLEGDMTPMLADLASRAVTGDPVAANMALSQLTRVVASGFDRGVLQKPEVDEKVYRPGDVVYRGGEQAFEIPAAPTSPLVTIGADGATPDLFKNIDQQFAAALETAGTSASARPQLEMLAQLAPLTTTGTIPAQISRMFPTFNDANTAFIGITNQVLPSLRVPGSGAQSDKDIDVLLNSIGNLGASSEVKQLLIQSLITKDQINQERADIAEQYASEEITRSEAIRKDRALRSRSILPEGLQGALNAISSIPKSAKDEGVTIDEWRNMTPADKALFK